MRTDSAVKSDGMNILREKLGNVDAERFVMLLLREPSDYTVWRKQLNDESITLRELSRRAMDCMET